MGYGVGESDKNASVVSCGVDLELSSLRVCAAVPMFCAFPRALELP